MSDQITAKRHYLSEFKCCVCDHAKDVNTHYMDLYAYHLPNDEIVWAHRPCAEFQGLKKYSRK